MGGNENSEKENVNLFLKNHEGEGSVIKKLRAYGKKVIGRRNACRRSECGG